MEGDGGEDGYDSYQPMRSRLLSTKTQTACIISGEHGSCDEIAMCTHRMAEHTFYNQNIENSRKKNYVQIPLCDCWVHVKHMPAHVISYAVFVCATKCPKRGRHIKRIGDAYRRMR